MKEDYGVKTSGGWGRRDLLALGQNARPALGLGRIGSIVLSPSMIWVQCSYFLSVQSFTNQASSSKDVKNMALGKFR